ncbi:PCNA-interacting partner [Patella vulgata]|uniref:PCNA-interacting partner n=1 Tax=Patella vulgata TaxID=6465 RepID=UPI0021807E0D|nr:PCNA-interacting partner [Patella vulgata]
MMMYLSCNKLTDQADHEEILKKQIDEKNIDNLYQTVLIRTLSENVDNSLTRHPTVGEYLIRLCREYKLLANERMTVLSTTDSLLAVQLCLSSIGKVKDIITIDEITKNHDFIQNYKMKSDADLSEPNEERRKMLDSYNDLLKTTNQLDIYDIYSRIKQELRSTDVEEESDLLKDLKKSKILCFGEPTTELEKSMLKLLCIDGLYEVEYDLTSCTVNHQSREITWLDNLIYQESLSQDTTPSTVQLYIQRVFRCYLELLLNTRSELALATIFNVPDRELGHHAFTALKHTSQSKRLPMYQTAVSHIIKLRLGGKAYAPALDCELAPFVKGLGELITFVQKLQSIVEEEADIRTACRRVISNIRTCIKKCKTNRLKEEDVQTTADYLHTRLTQIIEDREKINLVSPDKPASDGGSLLGRRTVRVLRQLLDSEVTGKGDNSECFLEDFALNPTTPTRIQCILSQFRSPEVCQDEEVVVDDQMKIKKRGLQDRHNIQHTYNSIPVPKDVRISKEEKLLRENLNSVIVIPSKTIVHAAPGNHGLHLGLKHSDTNKRDSAAFDKENIQLDDQPNKRQKTDVEASKINVEGKSKKGEKPSKKISSKSQESKKTKPQPKSCRRKLLPQVKGQQNITSFFRL